MSTRAPGGADRTVSAAERQAVSQSVTFVGALVNLVLSVAKIVFGWLGQSAALIADGIHSLSDLISDALVWFAAKHGSQEADEEHPYGHGRIETLATAALGGLLILVAIGLAIDAGSRMFHPDALLQPNFFALIVAGVSIAAKEWLYRYTLKAADSINSKLLRANAWHHRSDAVSSVVVVVGILGAMLGLPYMDALAAVVVAAMIGHIGWELVWGALNELVDAALEPEKVERLSDVIQAVEGVRAMHMLRTRRMGHEALADVHILVDPYVSVSEGHQISEFVRQTVIREFDEINDVTVHIDPEDDELAPSCAGLPPREQVEEGLNELWQDDPAFAAIDDIRLHYLAGKIEVEVFLKLNAFTSLEAARDASQRLKALGESLDYCGCCRVCLVASGA